MYFSLWKTPGVSEKMWSVNLEASISGEYQTLGEHSTRPSALLPYLMTGTWVPRISDGWYRSTMGVIATSLGARRRAGEIFGCTWECCRSNAGITNELCELPGFLRIYVQRMAGGIWDSSHVPQQSTSLNSKYNAWNIVHYHLWIILAIIFFNIVFCASLH